MLCVVLCSSVHALFEHQLTADRLAMDRICHRPVWSTLFLFLFTFSNCKKIGVLEAKTALGGTKTCQELDILQVIQVKTSLLS